MKCYLGFGWYLLTCGFPLPPWRMLCGLTISCRKLRRTAYQVKRGLYVPRIVSKKGKRRIYRRKLSLRYSARWDVEVSCWRRRREILGMFGILADGDPRPQSRYCLWPSVGSYLCQRGVD
jgi:hypothetical protein